MKQKYMTPWRVEMEKQQIEQNNFFYFLIMFLKVILVA